MLGRKKNWQQRNAKGHEKDPADRLQLSCNFVFFADFTSRFALSGTEPIAILCRVSGFYSVNLARAETSSLSNATSEPAAFNVIYPLLAMQSMLGRKCPRTHYHGRVRCAEIHNERSVISENAYHYEALQVIDRAVQDGSIPGATVLIMRHGQVVEQRRYQSTSCAEPKGQGTGNHDSNTLRPSPNAAGAMTRKDDSKSLLNSPCIVSWCVVPRFLRRALRL